jgi:hypothetical protein
MFRAASKQDFPVGARLVSGVAAAAVCHYVRVTGFASLRELNRFQSVFMPWR